MDAAQSVSAAGQPFLVAQHEKHQRCEREGDEGEIVMLHTQRRIAEHPADAETQQAGGNKGNRSVDRFDVDRAYLNFRATPGEHFAIRITADVYQQRDTTRDQYYRGWALRAKYAYVRARR